MVKCLNATKLKSMQRSGTGAIKTQLQPSKPKRVITNITNSQNTKITYGKPREQLFPKRWPLGNRNRTKLNMNTRRAKRHQKQVTEKKTHKKLPPCDGKRQTTSENQNSILKFDFFRIFSLFINDSLLAFEIGPNIAL